MNLCDHHYFKKYLWKFGSIHWDMKQKNKHWKIGDSIICIRYYYRSRTIKKINEKTLELIREFNKVSGYKVS